MTDHSDLIARLRAHVRDRGGMSRDAETGEIVLPNGAWAMMLAAADALSSQSLSLSEAAEALEQCEAYFDNRADADCQGDPAEFVPNREMVLLTVVRDALTKIGGRHG